MGINRIIIILLFLGIVCGLELFADGLSMVEKKELITMLRELKTNKLSSVGEREKAEEIVKKLQNFSEKAPKLTKIVSIWSKLISRAKALSSTPETKQTVSQSTDEENSDEQE